MDAHSLFIAHAKPTFFSAQTLAREIKDVMVETVIDTSKFKQHSACSALTAWLRKTKDFTMA